MHIHTAFFWLWRTAPAEQRKIFEDGLNLLASDPNVVNRSIGSPASTNRDVVDNSYDYALVLHFESLDAHNAYQTGEAHQRFLEQCAEMWIRVQVYDISTTVDR
ncbi:MAG: Dabb family protein [Rhodobacteraceae bacterium]|nr:Dabb family protein [Paracoccaceae bacterium]